jgi:hypothetical protein
MVAFSGGTLGVSDLLAATGQLIANYGEDRAFEAIQNGLDAHNEIVKEMVSDLAEVSSERLTRYGGTAAMTMVEIDEFGAPDTQKILPARDADVRRLQGDIATAFFKPTNNLTYVDRLYDNATLPLKALLNADGAAIPYGPNGETFDGSTHTHYLGTASLVAANVSALIETVLEHHATGMIKLYINRAQEAAVRAMANFNQYFDARLTVADTVTRATGALDITNLYDRAIGTFDSAEVWVQPWVPANYMLAVDIAAPTKPLRIRTRSGTLDGLGALTIAADHEHYPLRAQTMEREYGVAALTRWNGAALLVNNATYSAPTIAR